MSGLIPAAGEETFWCPNMLSLVLFAGITLNKCAVLWIGTLTGGPVQGESLPVLVKKNTNLFQNISMWSYLLRCRLQKRPHLLKKKKKKKKKIDPLPILPHLFGVLTLNTHICFIRPF